MFHYLEKTLASQVVAPTRRTFLKLSAGAVGGLLIGGGVAPIRDAQASTPAEAFVQPFVHITPDNQVTVIVKHLDMGQGSANGLATLVADELDADLSQLSVQHAPSNPNVYKNLLFGVQGTGGSTAIANSFEQYRQAGAAAKAMIVQAAAERWGVEPGTITVSAGTVSGGGNSATLGELASAAAEQPVPETVSLKAPEQWVYIGKETQRLDLPVKTQGSVGLFGIDLQQADALTAVTLRPPRFGATVASVDDGSARAVDGVVEVLQTPAGVVVVAQNMWSAMQGRTALEVTWDETNAEMRGTDELAAEFSALLDQPGNAAPARGDAAGKLASAATVIEADYSFPYLNHGQMEPLNATVMFDGEKAEFWFGSQIQTLDHNVAAAVLGIDFPNVSINTMFAGGSFGRRATPDAHLTAEAAMVVKAWFDATGEARPIKLVFTREDDMASGYFRPMHMHRVRAGVDENGMISGWEHRVVGQGIMIGTPFEAFTVKDGVDHSSVEGAADTTYDLPDFALDTHHPTVGIPVLWWRAVGHTHTAFVMETMMDELAEAAGIDPVAFRLNHLTSDARLAGVLREAADRVGPAPDGTHRGIAVHKSFNTYVAEIADVRLREDGTVKVEQVTCAIDCGVAVNPDNIRAQVEGGLGFGLSAVLREEITLTDGQVDQLNYPDYPPLRISDMPTVDVHIVASAEAPTGVGEPATPPIGPAVANAIYRATGQRIRSLPLTKHGLA
ncbi:xanthine dehydrogenase family protein molybdopterin-binding subunit [Marivita hallyeonensis]|uniref:Isoquinoline 1-oxidoreductase, beta subunit n=1 Tax=Marivita hallyeonensis TaxID=996342 RepID=A0A1M5X4H5_9RHOB|nr:xanthine dehydrogenase family protein molybdopterin-binding subunit [Marivita hallyeonensis]SHH94502.1 isoquinoline 1-oxidoreductase, beta subunit [Marivita hallyeonensis]